MSKKKKLNLKKNRNQHYKDAHSKKVEERLKHIKNIVSDDKYAKENDMSIGRYTRSLRFNKYVKKKKK